MRTKTHPATILKVEFMEPQKLKAEELAADLNIPASRLVTVLKERASIDEELAVSLAGYFGTSKEFWLNLQDQHDSSCTEYLLFTPANADRLRESLEDVDKGNTIARNLIEEYPTP